MKKMFSPECPECGAGGLKIRKITERGEEKNVCKECGNRWSVSEKATDKKE
jgi:transposase-like protein